MTLRKSNNRKQQATTRINDSRLKSEANRICRKGLNFLSGTVSPAKANLETMDIESIAHAFEHYAKRGITSVICQVKDMGSRGTAYISRDINDCYFTSRSGQIFYFDRHPALVELMQERIDFWFSNGQNEDIEQVIEDGEIGPWALIGKGLIDTSFRKYVSIAKRELHKLHELGFDRVVEDTIMKTDAEATSKMKPLLGAMDTLHERDELWHFERQVELYGNEGEAWFSPFNILKIVYTDGSEDICMDNNLDNYKCVGKHAYFVVDPSAWDTAAFRNWHYEVLSSDKEGIMIKPSTYDRQLQADGEDKFAPYMKVRNPDYLRIIYGYDYRQPAKLEKLIRNKRIGGKVRSSIKQYELGRALLEIPRIQLSAKNEDYFETVLEILTQFEYDTALDPRL